MMTAPKPITPSQHPIAPGTSIGHVHLTILSVIPSAKVSKGYQVKEKISRSLLLKRPRPNYLPW